VDVYIYISLKEGIETIRRGALTTPVGIKDPHTQKKKRAAFSCCMLKAACTTKESDLHYRFQVFIFGSLVFCGNFRMNSKCRRCCWFLLCGVIDIGIIKKKMIGLFEITRFFCVI
jgi:hypothetical protein